MFKILKKSYLITLSLVLLLTTFSFSTTSAKAIAKSVVNKNPYIEAYLNQKKGVVNQKSTSQVSSDDPLVDPAVEDQIIQDTLKIYYEEDLKVADFLVKYFNDSSLFEQTISLDKEEKVSIMHKIVEIYNSIDDNAKKSLLRDYLERYVVGTQDEETKKFLEVPEEDTEIKVDDGHNNVMLLAAFDRYAAATWAYNNYNKYSTNFPRFTGSFGTDCTNFVSQALLAGGMTKSGSWTISKKNSTYWIINSASELNYSWSLTDPSPWISVKEFRSYWYPKATGKMGWSTDYYRSNHKAIYNGNTTKGDVIIFHKGVAGVATIPTHAMIISDYDVNNYDFKLAGHSNERQAYPLLTAISNYSYIDILRIQ